METILAIPDNGDKDCGRCFGRGLSGIYRSYRKASECVYAELAKECRNAGNGRFS
jgi:hypothetical protein